jgi:hypothetical protein
MDSAKLMDKITVYNKPFFVNELLRIIQPGVMTPTLFDRLVTESREFEPATILTAMTRQIDCSGLVPNLAGMCSNPEEVLEVLVNLGHAQLLKIAQLEADLQAEVFDTLMGDPETSLRGLMVLDDCQRRVVAQLAELRQRSHFALALRQATENALYELFRDPVRVHNPMFDKNIAYEDRAIIYSGEPHICYFKHIQDDAVMEVWQYFSMPKLANIDLPEPYSRFSVEDVLDEVTPRIFRRGETDDARFDPRKPIGFIGLLGKVGGALPRLIARQIKQDEQIHARIMREEELASALYTLFSR